MSELATIPADSLDLDASPETNTENLEARLQSRSKCRVAVSKTGDRYEVTFTAHPDGDLASAAAMVREAMRPAPPHVCSALTAGIFAVCKQRETDDESATIQVAKIAGLLSEYPADIAAAAARRWEREHTFTPALADLKALADELVAERKAVADAVARAQRDAAIGRTPTFHELRNAFVECFSEGEAVSWLDRCVQGADPAILFPEPAMAKAAWFREEIIKRYGKFLSAQGWKVLQPWNG